MYQQGAKYRGDVPLAAFMDFVFERYHWDYDQFWNLPEAALHELQRVWRAQTDANPQPGAKRKPAPKEGQALIDEARAQGFPLPPELTHGTG